MLTALAGIPSGTLAHDGRAHGEPVDGVQAKALAQKALKTLVERGKLGHDWLGLEPTGLVLRGRAPAEEWVASFCNPREDAAMRRFFAISLDLDGRYLRSQWIEQAPGVETPEGCPAPARAPESPGAR